MKTKYIILTITLLFCFSKSVEAQNDLGAMFAGFESTAREEFSNISEDVKENLRKYWLRQGDIQMWMNAKYEQDTDQMSFDEAHGIGTQTTAYESEIYGEFDWDNKALMMKGTTTAHESSYEVSLGAIGAWGEKKVENPEETIVQYTDKDGYWYVPYDDPNGVHDYIKFNAKQTAQGALEAGQDLLMEIWLNDTATQLLGLSDSISLHWELWLLFFLDDYNIKKPNSKEENEEWMQDFGDAITYKKLEKIKEVLKVLYDEKMAETVGFPVFIHWALMYSPNYIKAIEKVSPSKYDCNGIKNGCTKLTVTTGENKGKSMKFDQYDRLTYINSLKDGTVRFAYDKDLTVNLPRAVTLSSMITSIGADNIEREKDREKDREKEKNMWDNYVKLKEKERKEEIENLREQEITELEKQLNEATTPQEREAAQEKIKELEALREKEREKEEENNN